jgi:hypothetical protein
VKTEITIEDAIGKTLTAFDLSAAHTGEIGLLVFDDSFTVIEARQNHISDEPELVNPQFNRGCFYKQVLFELDIYTEKEMENTNNNKTIKEQRMPKQPTLLGVAVCVILGSLMAWVSYGCPNPF